MGSVGFQVIMKRLDREVEDVRNVALVLAFVSGNANPAQVPGFYRAFRSTMWRALEINRSVDLIQVGLAGTEG